MQAHCHWEKSAKVSKGQSFFSACALSLKSVCVCLQITMPSLELCAMAVNSLLKLETGFSKLWATLGMTLALYAQWVKLVYVLSKAMETVLVLTWPVWELPATTSFNPLSPNKKHFLSYLEGVLLLSAFGTGPGESAWIAATCPSI